MNEKWDKIRTWYRNKRHLKWHSWVLGIISTFIIAFILWINFTVPGQDFLDRLGRSYLGPPREVIVEVYAGNTLIKEFQGYYTVETVDEKIMLINHRTRERIDILGDAVIVREDVQGEDK